MGSRQSRVESGVESAEAHADDIRSAAEASRSGDAVVLPGDLASQPVAQQSMRSPRDEFVTVRERNVTAPPPSTPEVGRLRELPDVSFLLLGMHICLCYLHQGCSFSSLHSVLARR